MKTCVFLILLLGFIQIIYCSNITVYGDYALYSVCPVKLFRRKRALEYTRWRANLESSSEFILKVEDEEPTTTSKPIVAVNIQLPTKSLESIIIGGAALPSTQSRRAAIELSREYTRFVPPTTIPATKGDGGGYIAPATPPGPVIVKQVAHVPVKVLPVGKHIRRDESPPASPQFLTRTGTPQLSRQYAPVTFTTIRFPSPTTSLAPRTPPLFEQPQNDDGFGLIQTTIGSNSPPTRTETTEDDYIHLHTYVQDIASKMMNDPTRSTFLSTSSPGRTKTIAFSPFEEDDFPKDSYRDSTRLEDELEFKSVKQQPKEVDVSYNNLMLYSDDDDDRTTIAVQRTSMAMDGYDEPGRTSELEHNKNYLSRTGPIDDIDNDNNLTTKAMHDGDYWEDLGKTTTQRQSVTIKAESPTTRSNRYFVRNGTGSRSVCNLVKLRSLNFNSPRTLPEITWQLNQWAENSPLAKMIDITNGNLTTMENPILMMIVDDPSSGQILSAKQIVLVVGGIQGRDHHAVSAAMYVLYQLVERSDAHSDLLTKYRFWVIPVFNPDGYDYSMTFPHRREWTKNLHQQWETCKGRGPCKQCEKFGLRCTIQPCFGVNLDRNFEYQWIPPEEVRAEHPCGSLHAGARQLSEPETRALTNFLHSQQSPLFAFIAFKEGDVLGVMYPYSHTRKKRAFDHIYRQRATRAAAAAYSISGRPFVAGQTSEFLPLYAGGIEDWVDGHLGIDNAYTIMMFRPTDSYNSKLITERVVHEAYAAMDTLLLQSTGSMELPKVRPAMSSKSTNTVPTSPYIVAVIVTAAGLST